MDQQPEPQLALPAQPSPQVRALKELYRNASKLLGKELSDQQLEVLVTSKRLP